MKIIYATILASGGKKQEVFVDDDVWEWAKEGTWYMNNRKKNGIGYPVKRHKINGVKTTTHLSHKIMNCPKGMIVDHINHITSDNQRINLRIADRYENARNTSSHKDAESIYLGVSKQYCYTKIKGEEKRVKKRSNRPWRARIRINGTEVSIGSFFTEIEAAKAYDNFAYKHFGTFAHLNFPEDYIQIINE